MRNSLYLVLLITAMLMSCGPDQEIFNNGNPGKIRVVLFLDRNRNGKQNASEPGVAEQIAISPDAACPANDQSSMVIRNTETNGIYVFEGLEPGRYCVMSLASLGATTPFAVEVFLSSNEEAVVMIGLVE